MFGKLFSKPVAPRTCPICGRPVEPHSPRCDGCGRLIGMPPALRHVPRDQLRLAPPRSADLADDDV